MSLGVGAAYVPTEGQVREARGRANRVVWVSFVAVVLVTLSLFIDGWWTSRLSALACAALVWVQHDAIKAARLLGHGI